MKTLVLGNAFVDVILNLKSLPMRGDDIECEKQTIAIGGCAYNVATILKLFNVDHQLVVPIGKGPYADMIKSELIKCDFKLVIQEKYMDNGYCLCLVEEDGERTFITVPGLETYYQKSWLDCLEMDDFDRIYLSGYEVDGPNGYLITNWLQQYKDKVIYFAPGPRMTLIGESKMNEMLRLNPILHLNKTEALSFTKQTDVLKAAKHLNELTKNKVFITLGKDGVLFYQADDYVFIESIPTEVVNTIGAGDSHIGAILALKALGYSDIQSCYIANKVAAKVVSLQSSKFEKDYFKMGDFI